MDGIHIDLTSRGSSALATAMTLLNHKHAVGYLVSPEKGLVFFWYEDRSAPGYTALPFKMDHAGMADFAFRWLAEADYGREPDHDGDNERGWRLYTEGWGRIGSWDGSFVAVKPAWAMFGK